MDNTTENNKMEILKHTIYRTYKVEYERKITDVVHNIPTWAFPESFGKELRTQCPVCHKEMALNIAHGEYIKTCSIIQLDGHDAMAIHTNCFFGDSNYFNQNPPEVQL